MKTTTLRLPESLYEDLVDEAEARDLAFSEYARMLLRNREANTPDEPNTQPNTSEYTGEYADHADRLAELEARVDELEAAVHSGNTPDRVREAPIEDDIDRRASGESDADPQGSTVERAVAHVRAHGPVRREDIYDLVEDEIDIKPRNWWRLHCKPALKEEGAEYTNNVGWQFPDE